jgi:hypothetical protein
MQNISARELVALAFIMSGTLLITGSQIYGVLYLPPSEQLSVWPLWVVALAPIAVGLVLLLRAIKTQTRASRTSCRVIHRTDSACRNAVTFPEFYVQSERDPRLRLARKRGSSQCAFRICVCVRNEEPAPPAICTA